MLRHRPLPVPQRGDKDHSQSVPQSPGGRPKRTGRTVLEEMTQYLAQIAVPDPDARRSAVQGILAREGFAVTVQQTDPTEQRPRGTQNYLLEPDGEEPYPLFCAHYDAYPASCGANDNGAAVCILIVLARILHEKSIRAGFAFLDGEEDGHSGARLYEAQRGARELSAVINLDMCGYGDTLTVYSHGSLKKPGVRAFCDKELLQKHGGRLVKYLPESDDHCFRSRRQPVLSVAVMPKWDAKYMDALATYNDCLLGKPPEFKMILGQIEVITTMHGAFRDGLKWVQPAAMQQVLDYLLDAVTAPPTPRRFQILKAGKRKGKEC
jgi:hypothetical protein